MSGWVMQNLHNIVFGLFMVAIGLMHLLDWAVPVRDEARARDWQLRYGNGGTDLRPRQSCRAGPASSS